MARFVINDIQACWVTFIHEIEADTEEEAREAYKRGEKSEFDRVSVGETIDGYEQNLEVEEI